ncbi:MAG: ArsR family transcriptional regulator, partial [Chloroflexi bacterium]|nr:ArsR family transcriptional regulator [Chloroflexota bacterium]
MEGTRLRILQLLQKNGNDTVDGLAKTIGLAPATIRRHLDILQRDRFVAFEEVRKKTGRPEYSFYLTEEGQEALPKDYDQLLSLVMEELGRLTAEDTRGRDGGQLLNLVFERLSGRMWSRYERQVNGKDLRARLDTLLRLLEQEDFFPEAEIVEDRLRIRLLNCPFRVVALQNKAVCAFDSNLISAMLDVDLTRESCIHDGDSGCIYTACLDAADAERLSASKVAQD